MYRLTKTVSVATLVLGSIFFISPPVGLRGFIPARVLETQVEFKELENSLAGEGLDKATEIKMVAFKDSLQKLKNDADFGWDTMKFGLFMVIITILLVCFCVDQFLVIRRLKKESDRDNPKDSS